MRKRRERPRFLDRPWRLTTCLAWCLIGAAWPAAAVPIRHSEPAQLPVTAEWPAGSEATAMAVDHFDHDGVLDLVVGYRLADGTGALAFYRGRAVSTPGSSPFEPGQLQGVPTAADWLVTGDFDADGRRDVATASVDRSSITWWSSTGDFELGSPREVPLGGLPTVVMAVDVHRRDGLADLVVAITGERSELLIFQSPRGALAGEVERFGLDGPVRALAAAELDGLPGTDIVAAAGSSLYLVSGRDRKQGRPESVRRQVEPSKVERFELDRVPTALATGHDLEEGARAQVAVLSGTGELAFLRRSAGESFLWIEMDGSRRTFERAGEGSTYHLGGEPVAIELAGTDPSQLVRVGFGGSPAWLAVGEPSQVFSRGPGVGFQAEPAQTLLGKSWAEVTAVLPARLNGDGLDDLLILRRGLSAPEAVNGLPVTTFTVTHADDLDDGACDAAHCSMREAIQAANASAGADAVEFAVGSGPVTLTITSDLPPITETLTLDGRSQPGYAGQPIVELVGNAGIEGLVFEADSLGNGVDNSCIRGLVIRGFDPMGLTLDGRDSAVIGNHFVGNAVHGIYALRAANLQIGGSNPADRNVFGSNLHSGMRLGSTGIAHVVQGNYIGIGADGTASLSNTYYGIWDESQLTTVGGPAPGEGNVISGDGGIHHTVGCFGGTDSLIQGNFIGTDASGLLPRGNRTGIQGGSRLMIGGSAPGQGNVIANSLFHGFSVLTSGHVLQGNSIGVGADGVTPMGNEAGGVRLRSTDNLLGGTEPGQGNVLAYNLNYAVEYLGWPANFTLGNSFHSNDTQARTTIWSHLVGQVVAFSSAAANATQTRVEGSFVDGIPNGLHRLEFFASPMCDISGYGEGEHFVGALEVTADGTGEADFSVVFPVPVPVGHVVTATTTLPGEGTSRFSRCEGVVSLPGTLLPTLSVPVGIGAQPGSTVTVPVLFEANGASIGAVAFELDFDHTCLGFDATDGDSDGLPDSVLAVGAAGFDLSVSYDGGDVDGELEILISQLPPLAPLPNGTLLELTFSTCSPTPGTTRTAPVVFTATPSPSFGDLNGQSVPGEVVDGSVEVLSGLRGDCNGDGMMDAGDLTACPLEIFDGDGDHWLDAPLGAFVGNPVGCDANGDTVIDVADVVCTGLLIFGNACGGGGSMAGRGETPLLTLDTPAVTAEGIVRITVRLDHHGAAVSGAAFSLDLGPQLELVEGSFEPKVPATSTHFVVDMDDAEGELDILVASTGSDPQAWDDGPVVELELRLTGPEPTWIRLSERPAASLADPTGVSLPVDADRVPFAVRSGQLFADSFETGTLGRWTSHTD